MRFKTMQIGQFAFQVAFALAAVPSLCLPTSSKLRIQSGGYKNIFKKNPWNFNGGLRWNEKLFGIDIKVAYLQRQIFISKLFEYAE